MFREWPEDQDAVRAMLRRVALVKTDDSGTQQKARLTGLASEELDGIVRVQSHGLTSNPPVDAEGLILTLSGRSDRAMVLGLEHKDSRPKDLPVGTAVLYDDKGNVVRAYGSDGLQVNAKSGVVAITSQADKVTVKPGAGKNVYLGGDGNDGTYSKVMTEDGPALNVYARIS